jgi:hypothetical protein
MITDEEITKFFQFIIRHLSQASELLADTKGVVRAPSSILTGYYILNEMTTYLSDMEFNLRHDDARKSRNDYLKLIDFEKEWKA